MVTRDRVQLAARAGALAFVILWLFSTSLQGIVPFWLPFTILAGLELEFLVGGIRERRREVPAPPAERRLPGPDDADLGWVETVDDEGEPVFLPAPPRPRRRSHLPLLIVLVLGAVLFVYAYRVDRDAGWSSVPAAQRAKAERRFTAEAATIAGHPVRVVCDQDYAFTGVGSDAAGVAFIPRGLAYLEPQVCRSLYRVAFEKKLGARDDAAFAITVLAHEAVHLRGERNEAETECQALQVGVALGERLGLDAGTARALMRFQRDRDLSDASISRLNYRLPADCAAR